MAMILPQTKRIKLEHSYAFLLEASQFEPVTIKQEDPLKINDENDIVETIKIEVADDDIVKTEPVEEIVNEKCDFEYLNVNVANENEHISPDQYTVDSSTKLQDVGSERDSLISLDNPIDDPLKLVRYEYVVPKVQKTYEKKSSKKSKEKNGTSQSVSFLRLQKDRDNLQKQIKKLKTDLKDAKAREKALQTELGARRMSEISLEEKKGDLNRQLQESLKTEKVNSKLIKELHQRLAHAENENLLRSDISERTRKDLVDKIERAKNQLKKKELEHKHLDVRCAHLTHDNARLAAKFDVQKTELGQVKQKLLGTEYSHAQITKSYQQAKQRVENLSREVSTTRRTNEELQKSLLTEKKMSRFFIRERDQLLEEQDAKFKEADRELVKLKQTVASLSAALNQKVAECKAQKEDAKVVMITYQRKSLELRAKMEQLEKKREELAKKVCEYCGF